jgi:hypothetical protein
LKSFLVVEKGSGAFESMTNGEYALSGGKVMFGMSKSWNIIEEKIL